MIALEKVEVESMDDTWRESGVAPGEVAAYEQAAAAEHERLRKAAKLEYLTTEDLRKLREKTARPSNSPPRSVSI